MISHTSAITLPTKSGNVTIVGVESKAKRGMYVYRSVPDQGPVDVRIHSSCVFSESLRTTDCDCASQLNFFLENTVPNGGVLVYVFDEGRGAGIMTKIEAIAKQQSESLNTAEAYRSFSLDPELRDFAFEAEVLSTMLPDRDIVLHTNNPAKVKGLERSGIKVIRAVRLVRSETDAIKQYLQEKVDHLGHRLEE